MSATATRFFPAAPAAAPLAAEGDGTRLQDALRLATSLVADARAFASALDLGDLDLPSTVTTPEDQARLRTVAPLYLASELESARLLPALELLAGVWASGGIATDLGPVGDSLTRFHRERHTRLTSAEREALFGRLFGKPYGPDLAVDNARNLAFDSLMIELAAALSDWHADASGGGRSAADEARMRVAAQQLAANLAARGGGVASFAGGEILGDIKQALSIFKEPAVQRALGSRSPWEAVGAVIRRFLQQEVDVASHVERGRTGIVLLAWLADALPGLDSGAIELPADETVLHAIRWMQATLALHERGRTDRTALAGG